ncbi:DUF664 domain-containing protein [Nocardia sp. NPDC051990]|uniref:mycothiol transferase n=1 Tax=Nocardia sp. NPDC051990 TaxID=3155285 RepID=UPI00341DFFFE
MSCSSAAPPDPHPAKEATVPTTKRRNDTPPPRTGSSEADIDSRYREAVERANEILDGCTDLGAPVPRPGCSAPSLRWALTHMIEETGRHAGHADILRELIDGTTGR